MTLNRSSLLYFSLLCTFLFFSGFSLTSPITKPNAQSPSGKALKQFFAKMIYMEADTFIMGRSSSSYINITADDSTLLTGVVPRKTVVDAFYISATEVTNGDWKSFYQAKVKELGSEEAKNKFFPDTSLWLTEFRYAYNAPHAKHYYAHPKFNNFPVVGISWKQANAYCQWKSNQLQSLLGKAGIQKVPKFRLPTEAEWENAALKKNTEEFTARPPVSFWSEHLQLAQINEVANTGQIFDINKLTLKQYADDGCLYTCQVASYPPNANGVYDMLGNVSEWTSDEAYVQFYNAKTSTFNSLSSPLEIDDEIERLKNEDAIKDVEMQRMLIESLEDNRKVLNSKDIKICKGGSWANGLIYTQAGSRQGFNKDKASTKIGFRLAMSDVSPEVKKYLPKKKWSP